MQIGFVIFDGVTQLDFTGPLQVLSRMPGATCALIAASHAPVRTDTPLAAPPTHSFADAPRLDILCVPGGDGVREAIGDAPTRAYLREAAAGAHYVTSVCTGALLLGAAGLLQGKRATTHWAYQRLLPLFGAEPVDERVVRDGNLITGGGVTAGVDFAFTLLRDLAGQDTAEAVQLSLEYNPQPPVDAGHPSRADAAVWQAVDARYAPRVASLHAAIVQALPSAGER
ncbi:MAG: DJ-1/PfpI family protein [Caulobacterales bacterium]|nr:DJ-1/PfpI family protein [Caulobacterales bacterium]